MNSSFITVASLIAIVAVVSSTKCPHDDLTSCYEEISCSPPLIVGCEHDTCTCVNNGTAGPIVPSSCTTVADCVGLNCKADEALHCFDNFCMCRRDH